MGRLLKLASNEYKLIGKIKFMESSEYDNDNYETDGYDYYRELKEAVDDSMSEMGPSGLALYLDYKYGDLEEDLIESIIIDIQQKGREIYSVAKVKAIRELNNDELEEIKDYIIGQYSDGWGEGFEQRSFAQWKDQIEVEDEYEEDGEYYTETNYESANFEMFASFYSSDVTYSWE